VSVGCCGASGRRLSEGRFQPEAEALRINGHHNIAIRRDRILDWRQRIAPVAQQLAVQQRLLGPQRRAGKRHPGEAARGRRAICRLERKRHLRPRALRTCHGVSFLYGDGVSALSAP
jgi:hypothetical protein